MTTTYLFPHDGPVYLIPSENVETVYYSRDGKKYKRIRPVGAHSWRNTVEHLIDNDIFWMVVACIERRNRHVT